MRRVALSSLLVIITAIAANAQTETLPDPLVFNDGTRRATAETWPERRAEIINMVLNIEYGTMPPAPDVDYTPIHTETIISHPGGTQMIFRFDLGPDVPMHVHMHLPDDRPPPFPVILRFGLGPEHAAAANARGYAFVCFKQTLLDPDTEGHDTAGAAQQAYPNHTWGSLAVWAWGASRVMDFLDTRPEIDTTRAVITGHSRTGKAALLAGTLDTRLAIVVPNGSGAGGTALYRGAGERRAETLELITRATRFKSWFKADFGQWSDREGELPFDQHFMRALVAPRVILNTEAYGDTWAHPRGSALAWKAAQPVFDLLGASQNNLIHIREGGHDQLAPDFAVLLDLADAVFADHAYPPNLKTDPFTDRDVREED